MSKSRESGVESRVLELRDITKTYRQGKNTLEVLKGASLSLTAGEMVALVGPSGAGKSTLLHIAGLLDTLDGGTVALQGRDISNASEGERTRVRRESIGFVYQFHHLLPEFSAWENVALPQIIAGVSKAKAKKQALALLASLGLEQRATHRPAELSGGEQQRVAIARALANNPALILADEPTGNLDPQTAEGVFQLFLQQAREKGIALFIATHNMDLARKMDRAVTLEQGKLASH
ncbi:MAG: ABC transporter ATP-binding protein [Alphaproteobacteria bacterium]|nr:ABC transporter ATP-binding protein [Alphaproteobacteria bacterium]